MRNVYEGQFAHLNGICDSPSRNSQQAITLGDSLLLKLATLF
jgi:hypothetical protein